MRAKARRGRAARPRGGPRAWANPLDGVSIGEGFFSSQCRSRSRRKAAPRFKSCPRYSHVRDRSPVNVVAGARFSLAAELWWGWNQATIRTAIAITVKDTEEET